MEDEMTIISNWIQNQNWLIRRYSRYGQSEMASRDACIFGFLVHVFPVILDIWNRKYVSRSRKPVDTFLDEASRRGYSALQQPTYPDADVWCLDFTKGGFLFRISKENGKRYLEPSFEYTSPSRKLIVMDAARTFDFLDHFLEVIDQACKSWDDELFGIRQGAEIGRIAKPYIAVQLSERFSQKGIRYVLMETDGGLEIYINLTKEIWLAGPVSIETLDHIVSMTPYVSRFPRDYKRLGEDFRVEHDYNRRIEKAWREAQTGNP